MPGAGAGKTILVTGGGGYIGSHCIHELLLEDYNVVAVDNFVNSVPGKILKIKWHSLPFLGNKLYNTLLYPNLYLSTGRLLYTLSTLAILLATWGY